MGVAAGSLTATGAVVLVADDSTADAVHTTLAAAAVLFAAPAADKRRYAATSDACGATGYRALSGKQVYDWRLNDLAGRPPTPDVVARAAPRAYARLSAAGRAVLAALSWSRLAGGGAEPPVDLGALCEPAPLPPQRQGASLLSLFRYEAGGGAAAPHVDRGLLTLVASTDAGLELRDAADETRWVPLTLQHGDVAVLVGATLAAATGQRLRAATHRVVAQQTPRSSVVLRLRGAPQALLPRISVAEFERTFDQAHVSVNRDGGGAGGIRTRGVEPVAVVGSVDLTSGRRPDDPASKRRRSVRQPEPAKVDQAIEIINIKIRDLVRYCVCCAPRGAALTYRCVFCN